MSGKFITLCFLVCLILTVDVTAQQSPGASEFAGTYVVGHSFGGSSKTLNNDGTYSEHSANCTSSTEESGKYVLSNGRLRFTILKYTGKQNGDEKEFDLFDPQARKKFLGFREDYDKVEPLKTEFSLLPVKWSERVYLIYETDLQDFSNAINLGLEPRAALGTEIYYGSFFLREGDEEKSVSGKPSLPSEWQSFLLSKPVTGNIIAIEEQGEDKIATIDKGSQDGLRVGMKLVVEGQEPTPWSTEGLILSVEEKTARVSVSDVKAGDALSTKYVPQEMYR